MFLQLNPPIPVETSKGPGIAHFLVDYSVEHDLYWVVFLDNSGECWTLNNKEIRAQKNISIGRHHVESFNKIPPNTHKSIPPATTVHSTTVHFGRS